MAYSNLQLNVTANTARALADFKKFSSTLDNKFLISGLKLDVVRNALSQINREFQKSIGEQGLASASSLRAAQNQASLLTQTFKGFASESARAINRDIGTALNTIAVKAGGTMKDVQKTLSATPFISTRISTDLRNQLINGMMSFQRDARRAGLGDNFSGIARQFLSGQVMGRDLISSDNPLAQFLGSEIMKRSGGQTTIYDPKARSEILAQIVGDKDIQDQLKKMAKQTYGYRIILEDLNTQLFNTEKGVFGSLRKVIDKTGKATTIFDEVYKLVEQVFGPSGTFKALFSSIAKVFKIGDPLRPFIDAVQFVTKKFGEMAAYFRSDKFTGFLEKLKPVIDRLVNIGKQVYETVSKFLGEIFSGNFSSAELKEGIRGVNKSIREYIQSVGKSIREWDEKDAADFTGGVAGTLFTEVGKTAIVLIKELLMTLVDKVPTIATAVIPEINKGINAILTEAFGTVGGKIAKFILGFVPGPIGQIARASAVGDVTGGGGNMFSLLAMGAGAFLGPKMLRRVFRDKERFETLNQLGNMAQDLETRVNRTLLLDDPTTGANRFSPLSRWFIDPLSRIRRPRGEAYNWEYKSLLNKEGLHLPFERYPADYTGSMGLRDFNLYRRGYLSPRTPKLFSPLSDINILGPSTPYGRVTAQTSILAGTMPYDPPMSILPPGYFSGRITSETSLFRRYGHARLYPFSSDFPLTGMGVARRRLTSGRPKPRGFGNSDISLTPEEEAEILSNPSLIPQIDLPSFNPDPDEVDRRYRRRYGLRGRLGRFLRRPGARLWAAGSVASTFALNALQQKADAAQQEGGTTGFLGSLGSGALQGASIGMAAGPWGALAGAAVGAGAAALMDKGFRDSIGQFLQNIGKSLTDVGKTFGNWMKTIFKGLANGLLVVANAVISSTLFVPRVVSQLIGSIPGIDRIPGVKNSLQGIQSGLSYQIPYFYGGKNFAGPALFLESRMSGRNPMVVNDGEFVIPNNGFTTLADLVSQRVRSTQPAPEPPLQLQLNINLTSTALVTDPDELTKALRPAVIQIVNDAWDKATQKRILRPKIA